MKTLYGAVWATIESGAKELEKKNRIGGRPGRGCAFWGLCLLIPVLIGGCPEFQNASVTAVETASRGVLDAALDLFFDQFRTDRAS